MILDNLKNKFKLYNLEMFWIV